MAGKKKEVLYSVAINDADYQTYITTEVGGKRKVVWKCPFHVKWTEMLARCYNIKRQKASPWYVGCSVSQDWLRFSNFKAWMEKQDWEGKHLDKDLLCRGNKIYSAENCCFIDQNINSFITESSTLRGDYPIGVSKNKDRPGYRAYCRDGNNKLIQLGNFQNPEDAHNAWLQFKLKLAKELAMTIKDTRVAEALIERYKNYR